MNKKCTEIYGYLDNLFENPRCELEYDTVFELLVAVILSSQCTDKRVNVVTKDLFKKYNKPQDFAKLSQSELESKIRSCGFYHNKAKNIIGASKDILERFGGVVPNTLEALTSLSGVGRKTANVVLSEGFKQSAIAVDTHVFRVSLRLELSGGNSPKQVEFDLQKIFDQNLWSSLHQYLVLFGRYYCKSKNPKCEICGLKKYCKYYKENFNVRW